LLALKRLQCLLVVAYGGLAPILLQDETGASLLSLLGVAHVKLT
jgi:hypothetical protein